LAACALADDQSQVSGRVKALREMFNKGGSPGAATPEKAPVRSLQFNKFVAQGACARR
jgi:hypothetical protein